MDGEFKFACPACGQRIACDAGQAGLNTRCPACQEVLAVPDLGLPAMEASRAEPGSFPARRAGRSAWISLAAGLGIAFLAARFPFLGWVFHYLGTIIHELGHWVVLLLFAYPSVPVFHFVEGGATVSFSRMPLLLLAAYGAWIHMLWRNRGHRPALVGLGGLFAGYVFMAHTGLDKLAALAAGYAAQLLVAGVFLYRAWARAAILAAMERPLYAALGFHMVGVQLAFAFSVLWDGAARNAYIHREDVVNDFVELQNQAGVSLDLSLAVILVCAMAVPALSFLAFRYQAWWSGKFQQLVGRA
jgi:hypothetical protein